MQNKTRVIDVDLKAYFDNVRHHILLKKKGLSYQAIINKLNEKDIPTKNRKNWSKSTILGILKNPIYDNLIPIRS